jgi:Mn2+/Fe2+ NRAMP family transporter
LFLDYAPYGAPLGMTNGATHSMTNGAMHFFPVVLVLMLLLINNKRLMGQWTNNLAFNVIAWTTVVIVSLLTAVSTIQTVIPSGPS